MEHDWTFEATDRVSGRRVTIDRRWDNWLASDPINALTNPYDPSFCEDERLYRASGGDYVLVWRADQLRPYYECDYMPERESRDWFRRQNIPWPDEHFANAAPTLNIRSYRSLWEFARRVEHALGCVLCAGCNLCREELRLEWDADAPTINAAVAELDGVMRPIDVDDWKNTPNGADELVNTLFAIQAETRSLIIKVGHSLKPLSWNGDFKKLSLLHDFLEREIAGLASIPELECELHAEALRKLQAPAPATAAIRQRESANAQLTPDDEEELELLFPTVNAKPENDATTETAVVAGDGVAVVAKPEGKVAVEAATLQMVAGRVPVAPPNDFELSAMWAPSQLAERFGLSGGALTKALQRWRGKNGDGWHEVENRKPREPKYTYRLSAVMPLINGMLAASSEQGASSEMSA